MQIDCLLLTDREKNPICWVPCYIIQIYALLYQSQQGAVVLSRKSDKSNRNYWICRLSQPLSASDCSKVELLQFIILVQGGFLSCTGNFWKVSFVLPSKDLGECNWQGNMFRSPTLTFQRNTRYTLSCVTWQPIHVFNLTQHILWPFMSWIPYRHSHMMLWWIGFFFCKHIFVSAMVTMPSPWITHCTLTNVATFYIIISWCADVILAFFIVCKK